MAPRFAGQGLAAFNSWVSRVVVLACRIVRVVLRSCLVAIWGGWYLAVMFLFDVGEECGVAEVGLAAGALVIPGFDGKTQVLTEGVLPLHKTINY